MYLNGYSSITPQETFEKNKFSNNINHFEENILHAQNYNYKTVIPANTLRRMAKGSRMSMLAAKTALADAGVKIPDSIITGTGWGCLIDSEKFLENVLENEMGFINPTPFIQSTHNAIGGQIALALNCKGYNMTYVHDSNSFESAICDAKLQFDEKEIENVLIGGVDEIGKQALDFFRLNETIKSQKINNLELFNTSSCGSILGEGAHFSVWSQKKTTKSILQLIDIELKNEIDKEEFPIWISTFLKKHELSHEDMHLLIIGKNGDMDHDFWFNDFCDLFSDKTNRVAYKHMIGENPTASAFAIYLAAYFSEYHRLPKAYMLSDNSLNQAKYILTYNQNASKNHSLVLMKTI